MNKINISSMDKEVLGRISKLGRDTINYVPARIIPAILSIIGISIFTRIFTPNEYGQYSIVIATTGIMIPLLSEWVRQSTLRFFPNYQKNNQLVEFKQNLIFIVLFLVVLFTASSAIAYPFLISILGEYGKFYIFVILLITAGVIFTIFVTIFQATLQPQKYSKYHIAFASGRIMFALIFVLLIAKNVVWLVIGAFVSYAVLIIPMIREIGLFKLRKGLTKSFNLSLFKKFAFYGFPMIGWFLGGEILNISDRFLIEIFRGSAEVGIYSSNYNLVNSGIGLFSGPLIMAAHPLIINAWESGSKDKISAIISNFSRYFLLMAIPLIVYFIVFGQEVISILLGKSFREGYVIIPIVLLGFLAWNFAMYGHKGLEIAEKTKIMFFSVLVCALTNIILNFIFIPKYGYLAAAVTTLVSYLLYPIIIYFATKPYLKWQIPWLSLVKISISSVVAGSILITFKYINFGGFLNIGYLIIFSVVGLLLYGSLLYLLGELRSYEIQYFWKRISRLIRVK